jgi:hypothetical protein
MVVIPIFGGLLAGLLSLFWPSKLGILPRFLGAALSASTTAMLFGLIVYFFQARRPIKRRTLFIQNILTRFQRK